MPRQNIGVRVPDDVLQAIDARCKASNLSRTEVVLALIQYGLELAPSPEPTDIDKVSEIKELLATLTDRVEALEQTVSVLTSAANAPSAVEHPGAAKVPAASKTLAEPGMTLGQICDHYALSAQNIARNSRAKGQTVLEYLATQTGVQWVQRGKRYQQL